MGETRRDIIKKGAVAGGIVWAAPTVLSMSAASAASLNPTGCVGASYGVTWQPPATPASPQNPGYLTYDGDAAIGTSGWVGSNVDVMVDVPSFGRPSWMPSGQWVDLIGAYNADPPVGSVATTFELLCPGILTIDFLYGVWYEETTTPVQVAVIIDVSVDSRTAPAFGEDPESWATPYAVGAGPHTVRIQNTGGGPSTAGSGAAIGGVTVTFTPT